MTGTAARDSVQRFRVGPLSAPRALLLDFGGVVVESTHRPEWPAELARELHTGMAADGVCELTQHDIELDLRSGHTALRAWRNAMSRPFAPRESTYEEFWRDFVAADWPDVARKYVAERSEQLCRRAVDLQSVRKPRRGIGDLLQTARDRDIRVGIVSNAMVGDVHRVIMRDLGLADLVGVQIYSDEVGLRKPNPELIHLALRELDVPAGQAWYVGDHFDRDVVCGRRAGVGGVVLMIAPRTGNGPFRVRHEPDLVVDDPADLLNVLRDV